MLQETRVVVWRADQNFDLNKVSEEKNPEAVFFAYLKRTICRKLEQFVNRHQKHSYNQDLHDSFEQLGQAGQLHAMHHQHLTFLINTILNPVERTFYRLHIVHNYSITQIAKMLGVSRYIVYKWEKQTLTKLRREFRDA